MSAAGDGSTEPLHNVIESLIRGKIDQHIRRHPFGWRFLLAEDEKGFERAAPVRKLVQKVSGGHFLARGRIH